MSRLRIIWLIMAVVASLTTVLGLEQCAEDCFSSFGSSGSSEGNCNATDTACQCRDKNFNDFMPCCLFDACSSSELQVVPAKVKKACEQASVHLDVTDTDWECMPRLDEPTTSVPQIPSLVLPTRSILTPAESTIASSTATMSMTTTTTAEAASTTERTVTRASISSKTDSVSMTVSMTESASPTSTTEGDQTRGGPSPLTVGLGVGLGVGVPVLIAVAGLAHILRLIKHQGQDGPTSDTPLCGTEKGYNEATATRTDATYGPGELLGDSTHKQELAGTPPVMYAELP